MSAYRMARARIGLRHKVDRIEALPKIVRDIEMESASSAVHSLSAACGLAAKKTANVVNVAIAREMVGFIWSIACAVSIGAAGGMTHPATANKRRQQTKDQPRRGMRRWGRDNAGEPSCAL